MIHFYIHLAPVTFHPLHISPLTHLVPYTFRPLHISSLTHLVPDTSRTLHISSLTHIVSYTFCPFHISSLSHFVPYTSRPLHISSLTHFVPYTFHRCYFVAPPPPGYIPSWHLLKMSTGLYDEYPPVPVYLYSVLMYLPTLLHSREMDARPTDRSNLCSHAWCRAGPPPHSS